MREYSPYISISGVFFIDHIVFPQKSQNARSWEIREVVGNKYKYAMLDNKDTSFQNSNLKISFKIDLGQDVYIKDLDSAIIGRYEEESGKWSMNNIGLPDFSKLKENKTVTFFCNELANYSILLERKIFFPYKSWYLRCTDGKTAVLDLESKIFKFYVFCLFARCVNVIVFRIYFSKKFYFPFHSLSFWNSTKKISFIN